MSLKNKYKSDSSLAREGVWIDLVPNSDGTVPGFKLARVSKQNKRYGQVLSKYSEQYAQEDGSLNAQDIGNENAEKMLLDTFLEAVLLDWRNFQPEDDGVALPYSIEAARAILGDEDWYDLYAELNTQAHKVANFRQKAQEAQAKNS